MDGHVVFPSVSETDSELRATLQFAGGYTTTEVFSAVAAAVYEVFRKLGGYDIALSSNADDVTEALMTGLGYLPEGKLAQWPLFCRTLKRCLDEFTGFDWSVAQV